MKLIEEKSKGKTLKLQCQAAKPATTVVDLMQRLKERVAQTSTNNAVSFHFMIRQPTSGDLWACGSFSVISPITH